MSTDTSSLKKNESAPPIYLYLEDENGQCACGNDEGAELKQANFETKIEDNKLRINLSQYGAMPVIGPADEIAAVRVHVRGKEVLVFAIYEDPLKTATMGCCSGSGCYCCARGCYC